LAAIAGGGENLETPEAAAARELLRELNGLLTDPQCRFDAPAV
jgi:hypothetical protein